MVIKNLHLESANPTKKDWAFLFINLLIVLFYGCILFVSSFNYSQRQYAASLKQKQNYKINSIIMQNTITSLGSKNMDLATDLPHLQAKYTSLVELSLMHKNDSNSLIKRKNEIINYLGSGFYQRVYKIPKNVKFSKIKTIVTFGKFDSKTRQIDTKLYATCLILYDGHHQKSGVIQASIKYDLLRQKARVLNVNFEVAR